MAQNLVRRREDNVVEWFGSGFTFVDVDNGGEPATNFTIVEASASMQLPENGWDYIGREPIVMEDEDVPDTVEAGAVLNGESGSYTWA